MKSYFVYILTNPNRTTLYIGVTNDLRRRIGEHAAKYDIKEGFTGKYNLQHLIYFEAFNDPKLAIAREKQLKSWVRSKKEKLIATQNPEWHFLENEI